MADGRACVSGRFSRYFDESDEENQLDFDSDDSVRDKDYVEYSGSEISSSSSEREVSKG